MGGDENPFLSLELSLGEASSPRLLWTKDDGSGTIAELGCRRLHSM